MPQALWERAVSVPPENVAEKTNRITELSALENTMVVFAGRAVQRKTATEDCEEVGAGHVMEYVTVSPLQGVVLLEPGVIDVMVGGVSKRVNTNVRKPLTKQGVTDCTCRVSRVYAEVKLRLTAVSLTPGAFNRVMVHWDPFFMTQLYAVA